MGEWSERVMAGIRDRLENECDAIGVEMVADIRQAISVPVEITIGANDMRLRRPAATSAAAARSMWWREEECTSTCMISHWNAASRSCLVTPSHALPIVG